MATNQPVLASSPDAGPTHLPVVMEEDSTQAALIPGLLDRPREMRPLGVALADAGIAASDVSLRA